MDAEKMFGKLEESVGGMIGELPYNILVLVVTVIITMVVLRLIVRMIRIALSRSPVGQVSLIVNIVRVIIVVVAVCFVGENAFHLEMTGLVQTLGIGTIVLSLGLQDLLQNIGAGILIIVTRVLNVGDQVEIGTLRGEVIDIGLRQTIVRDKDNNPNVIPNASIMSNSFVRLDGQTANRYLFTIEVKPGLDLAKVGEDIERLSDEVLQGLGIAAGEGTQVRFLGSTANGIQASVRIFLKDVSHTTDGTNAVLRAISQRGYLTDWTNDYAAQERWR